MDDDIFDGDQSSDSDAVDEDLEHQLYGAIFFGGNFLPSKEVEEGPNVVPKDSSGSLLVNCPLASELVTLENQAASTETLPSSDILIDLTRDSTNKVPVNETINNENETVVQELVGSVVVSSFKDHSDSDESFKQHYPGADVGADSPSTDYITEESECESICSISVGNSKLLCSTPRNFSAPNHDPGSIVLGVSREGSSIVCNADDSVVIAQILETSSKDPSFWRINHEDLMTSRSKKSRDRYFNDSKNSVCAKCERKGHLAFECHRFGPTCILCGMEGHRREECNRIYCYACFSPGHSKHNCTLLECLKRSVCKRCGLQGHQAHLCTELWRQYKNTVQPGRPNPIPRKMDIQPGGCCNCGNGGHTVDECRRKPFRSNFLGPPPHHRVLVYDQKDIYRRSGHSGFGSSRVRFKAKVKSVDKERPLIKKLKSKKDKKKSRTGRCDDLVDSEQIVKKRSKKKKIKTIEANENFMSQSDVSLTEFQRSVNEKLFEQISKQLHKSEQDPIEIPARTGVESCGTSTGDLGSSSRRRSRMDEPAFLPLEQTTTDTSTNRNEPHPSYSATRRNNRRQNRHFRRNSEFSAFTWINERTAENKLNDERLVVRETKSEKTRFPEPLFSFGRSNNQARKRSRLVGEETVRSISKKHRKSWDPQDRTNGMKEDRSFRKSEKKNRNHKEVIDRKKKTKLDSIVPPKSKRKARLLLNSLLVDTSQSPKSSFVETPTAACETPGSLKNKKGAKRKESVNTKPVGKVKISSSTHKNHHRSSSDWQTFLRESHCVDSWEHYNGSPKSSSSSHVNHFQSSSIDAMKKSKKWKKSKRLSGRTNVAGQSNLE